MLDNETIDLVRWKLRLQGEDGMHIARRRARHRPSRPDDQRARGRGRRVMGLDWVLTTSDQAFSPRERLARIPRCPPCARPGHGGDAIAQVRAYRFGSWELNIGRAGSGAATAVPWTDQRRVQPAGGLRFRAAAPCCARAVARSLAAAQREVYDRSSTADPALTPKD